MALSKLIAVAMAALASIIPVLVLQRCLPFLDLFASQSLLAMKVEVLLTLRLSLCQLLARLQWGLYLTPIRKMVRLALITASQCRNRCWLAYCNGNLYGSACLSLAAF